MRMVRLGDLDRHYTVVYTELVRCVWYDRVTWADTHAFGLSTRPQLPKYSSYNSTEVMLSRSLASYRCLYPALARSSGAFERLALPGLSILV